MGWLMGWPYMRTGSILPAVVFHWANNTVAYLMFNLMRQLGDGKLIDLFHGSSHSLGMGLFFSVCIILPCLFQLNMRMKKG